VVSEAPVLPHVALPRLVLSLAHGVWDDLPTRRSLPPLRCCRRRRCRLQPCRSLCALAVQVTSVPAATPPTSESGECSRVGDGGWSRGTECRNGVAPSTHKSAVPDTGTDNLARHWMPLHWPHRVSESSEVKTLLCGLGTVGRGGMGESSRSLGGGVRGHVQIASPLGREPADETIRHCAGGRGPLVSVFREQPGVVAMHPVCRRCLSGGPTLWHHRPLPQSHRGALARGFNHTL
jgi:hypothetical protein